MTDLLEVGAHWRASELARRPALAVRNWARIAIARSRTRSHVEASDARTQVNDAVASLTGAERIREATRVAPPDKRRVGLPGAPSQDVWGAEPAQAGVECPRATSRTDA